MKPDSIWDQNFHLLQDGIKNVVIPNISVPRAIFVIFCARKDTEYEKWVMELSVYWPIYTKEKTIGSMGPGYPPLSLFNKSIVVILNINGAKAIVYYSVITTTLNLSDDKWKLAEHKLYTPIIEIIPSMW